ncbi:MAG: CBS domain-containing protein [Acidobacteria bacterium]|nr:CBS domain-containing protein [Acidobacteriota bacterium]
MKIVTTHLSADFDGFSAAVVAAWRLFPGHRVVFAGSLEAAVRRFVEESGLEIPEVKIREVRRTRLEHAVVVDTSHPGRLGEVWDLIQRDNCPVTIIDHHEPEPGGIEADEVFSGRTGAACTLVATLLEKRNMVPTPEEASLLLMGIYEDTGGLSYRETTPEDLRVAAGLLEAGGSLEWIQRWVLRGLEPGHFELLNRLVEATERTTIHGVEVSIATVDVQEYHEEAAYVVHRWMETFDLAVGAALLVQPPHINLILRSRVPGLHAGHVARHFGGGGHQTAASARILGKAPVELREELLRVLRKEMPPPLTAGDIALSRIFTVTAETSVESAKERMNHLRINALPVTAEDSARLVGTLTRQILDQAVVHGLGAHPVRMVMRPGVPTVPADMPLEELGEAFLERSYRFVIVEKEGRPVGLITRIELFRRLFQARNAGANLDNRIGGTRPARQAIGRRLRTVAPGWVGEILGHARAVANARGEEVYLVGGVVRDLLLERPNEDVDLVVEGDGIAFAEALARETGGRSHPHAPFLTAVVILPSGKKVDVASARTEFYRTPAALPEVETSLIRQDLYRRDFTINALAVALAGDRFGTLVDFFGGRKDIERREIRVLHSLSFIDDPTRAIRAVRYARRLGFVIAADTRYLISTALAEGVLDRLSGQRLRHELVLLLNEPHPAASIELLAELGLLRAITPRLTWDERIRSFLLELEGVIKWFEIEGFGSLPERWSLFLGALALHANGGAGERLAERLQLTGRVGAFMAGLGEHVRRLTALVQSDGRRSQLVRLVEKTPLESVLLTMTGLGRAARRRLADAIEASLKGKPLVTGADLIAAGIPPGPHVGRALKAARDAVLDGEIDPGQAVDLARTKARELMSRAHRRTGEGRT